jgi:hypothetical protein
LASSKFGIFFRTFPFLAIFFHASEEILLKITEFQDWQTSAKFRASEGAVQQKAKREGRRSEGTRKRGKLKGEDEEEGGTVALGEGGEGRWAGSFSFLRLKVTRDPVVSIPKIG